jgi:O-antigen ligase
VTPRLLALACGGLVLLRAALPAQPPALVDAHAALVACALVAVLPASTRALRICALVLLALCASLPVSWDPWFSLLASPVVLGALAFFLIGNAATPSLRVGLLGGVALAGALNAFLGGYQRAVLYPRTLAQAAQLGLTPDEIGRLGAARPLGMSLSPDLAGALSLAGLFAAGAIALAPAANSTASLRARMPAGIAAAMCLGGVLLSKSAGTAMALVVGLIVTAFLLGERKRAMVGLVGAALPVGAVLASRGVEPLLHSAGERIENYRTAFLIFLESPFLGVGYGRFAPAYAALREPGSNVTRYAHGAWAQGTAEHGLVGVLAIGGALVLFVVGVRAALKATTDSPWRAIVVGGVVALGTRALIDYDLQIGQTAAIAAVLAGLALSGIDEGLMLRAQRAGAITAGVVLLVLVVVLGMRESALRSDALDPAAVQAYADRASLDVEAQIAQARFEIDGLATCADTACDPLEQRARARLDALCARAHPISAALLLRAQLSARTGELGAALADADAALRVDPGSEVAHRMGISLADQLDLDLEPRLAAAQRWGLAVGP